MELIEGVNFLEHVRGGREPGSPAPHPDVSTPTVSPEEAEADPPVADDNGAIPMPLVPAEIGRLRSALGQLAEGLRALHEAGKLHRDIKPSNVLVSHGGRLTLLDFGLVGELRALGLQASGARRVMGTPSYMSPEQARGAPLTEASDWCSVGVMLYVALTGVRPFPRRPLDGDFEIYEPRRPGERVPGVPEDLDRLCQGLLRHDPAKRPSLCEIVDVARGREARGRTSVVAARPVPAEGAFVGRARELRELENAFQAVKEGRPVALYVGGASGIGKSTLVHHFLGDLQRRETVALLEGRCYEREAVPFKAMDSLIDGLSGHLRGLPAAEVERLLPQDLPALARLFPVLRTVEAVAAARRAYLDLPDLREVRRRAFRALRELLARLASRAPLVLFIDDVHWGDEDSAALLADLWRQVDTPPLLLLGTYRAEDEAASPLVQRLLEGPGPDAVADVRRMQVEAFSLAEACELAQALLGPEASPFEVEALARESAGNPFLLRELARYTIERAPVASASLLPVTVDTVLRARVAGLSSEARRLLEAVSVAGQPVSLEAARGAARLESGAWEALRLLGALHLVRTSGVRQQARIEPYHHRIREVVLAALASEDLASLHRRLAVLVEAAGEGSSEMLAVHFAAGGDRERAAEHAAAAAQQAFDALAFERAARLFRWTLDLQPRSGAEARSVRVKLGDALANSARCVEAAEAYLAAAEGAPAAEALDLRRRAAEQLLTSGHFDQGTDVLRAVLRSIGMKLAETPARALLSLLWRRALIRLRGLSFRERDATQVAAEALIRIDTCWTVAVGMSFVDTIRGADFQARQLLLALRSGEPHRVARALAIEVGYQAMLGTSNRARTEKVARAAMACAERVSHPHALALLTLSQAAAAFFVADWPNARVLGERATQMLRERCTGVAWELHIAQQFMLLSLLALGELRHLTERLSVLLAEAEDRGDLYVATSMRTRVVYVAELAADRPGHAREEVRRGMRLWSREGFHVQHLWELFAHVEISLYTGEGLDAWQRMSAAWPLLVRSRQLRIQNTRIWSWCMRAQSALAAAAAGGPPGLVALAARDARRMEAERTVWGDALAQLVRAGVARERGETERALACLARAETGLEQFQMRLYAASARRHRGRLLGGEEGRALVESADAVMRSQGIQNPARIAAKLAAGGPAAP
jgi:hypothetical protein